MARFRGCLAEESLSLGLTGDVCVREGRAIKGLRVV